jgi:hypothetical protein
MMPAGIVSLNDLADRPPRVLEGDCETELDGLAAYCETQFKPQAA